MEKRQYRHLPERPCRTLNVGSAAQEKIEIARHLTVDCRRQSLESVHGRLIESFQCLIESILNHLQNVFVDSIKGKWKDFRPIFCLERRVPTATTEVLKKFRAFTEVLIWY